VEHNRGLTGVSECNHKQRHGSREGLHRGVDIDTVSTVEGGICYGCGHG